MFHWRDDWWNWLIILIKYDTKEGGCLKILLGKYAVHVGVNTDIFGVLYNAISYSIRASNEPIFIRVFIGLQPTTCYLTTSYAFVTLLSSETLPSKTITGIFIVRFLFYILVQIIFRVNGICYNEWKKLNY